MGLLNQFPFLLVLLQQLQELGIPWQLALLIVTGIATAIATALDAMRGH